MTMENRATGGLKTRIFLLTSIYKFDNLKKEKKRSFKIIKLIKIKRR